ncbi:MAG: hypothetical protein WC502_10715 [Methanolinea sp.]|jgi:hypothetical protein
MKYQKLRTRREPVDARGHRTGVAGIGQYCTEQDLITNTCEETICAE